MKKEYAKAKQAVEKLFWDTCFVEIFTEESTDWGEIRHQKGEGDSFPCRLTEKAVASGENGLLTEIEKAVMLIYPADKNIPAGNAVLVQKENSEERRYFAAGESQAFLTHKAVVLKRRDVV